MKISENFVNYNKEIIFGQFGALIGTQIGAYFTARLNLPSETISTFIVIGSIVVASLFWVGMRIYDKTRKRKYSPKKFVKDIEYFTPAAFILTVIFYYPTLYFLSKYLIEIPLNANLSAAISQAVAFAILLTALNIYRIVLFKFFRKRL